VTRLQCDKNGNVFFLQVDHQHHGCRSSTIHRDSSGLYVVQNPKRAFNFSYFRYDSVNAPFSPHNIYSSIIYIAPHPSGHRTLLPVGPAYLRHLQLSLHYAHSFSSLDKHLTAERERLAALHGEDAAGEDDLGVGDEEEPEELLNLDPKEWKVRLLSSWNFLCSF